MTFKEIKRLIYSPILLVVNDQTMYPMSVDNISSNYDRYEVIGIRSLNSPRTNYEDAIVISLKEPLEVIDIGNPYHNEDKYKRYDNVSICKD